MSGQTHAWLRRSADGWRWTVRADFARHFQADDAPDWPNLRADTRATLFKTNDEREVWRVEANGQLLFVKVARPPRGWARWRRFLLGADAPRERRAAEYAATHGIDAVTVVAAGEGPIAGRRRGSILVTIGRPAAVPLSTFWARLDTSDPATRAVKNRVVDTVARLIAGAHQNGFRHPDLHAGNVLIEPAAHGEYRALFVDLHNTRTGRALSDHAVVRNLAQFNQWFHVRGLLSDRIRFLDRYLLWRDALADRAACPRGLGLDRRALIRAIDRAAREHAAALHAKRDRRVLRSGRYFTRLTLGGGWKAHVLLESKHPLPGSRASALVFTAQQWRRWLSQPPGLARPADQRVIIKESASSVTYRANLPLEDAPPLQVVCKRASQSFADRIRSLFRPSRAMLAWKRGNALINRRVPTSVPLAVVEKRRFGLCLASIILTESVEHGRDLDTLLTVDMRRMPGHRQRWLKDRVIESLARIMRRLQDTGYTHRDLKAPNVIVQWNPDHHDSVGVLLVDLDGLRPAPAASGDAWMRACARLNVSLDHCRRVTATDRLRFIHRCLMRVGPAPADARTVWRTVAGHSARKREGRTRRRAEMLARYGRF